jgi:hypothetical protein
MAAGEAQCSNTYVSKTDICVPRQHCPGAVLLLVITSASEGKKAQQPSMCRAAVFVVTRRCVHQCLDYDANLQSGADPLAASLLRCRCSEQLLRPPERHQRHCALGSRLGVWRGLDRVGRLMRDGRIAEAHLAGVPRELDEALGQRVGLSEELHSMRDWYTLTGEFTAVLPSASLSKSSRQNLRAYLLAEGLVPAILHQPVVVAILGAIANNHLGCQQTHATRVHRLRAGAGRASKLAQSCWQVVCLGKNMSAPWHGQWVSRMSRHQRCRPCTCT